MMLFSIVTYRSPSGARAGLLNEGIIDVAEASGIPAYSSVLGLLGDWEAVAGRLEVWAQRSDIARPYDPQLVLAPIPLPGAVYCAGANYADHVAEMAAKLGQEPGPDPHTLGLKPWHFIKSSHSVVGPGAAVPLPADARKVDWEIELAAVIGRRAKHVSEADALGCVAGYALANDLSARDLGFRAQVPQTSPFHADWVAHKSFDGSCPLGPGIVPAAQIDDPQNIAIRLWVNDVLKQDSNTSQMIFTLAEQIAQLSHRITLYPGDVILTGTPAGVGAGRDEFLRSGDRIRMWAEGIGTLEHTVV